VIARLCARIVPMEREDESAKGPRQKVVCSLGDLSPRPRAQWLKLAHRVEAALGGQPQLLAAEDAEVAQVVERVRRGRPRRQRAPRRT